MSTAGLTPDLVIGLTPVMVANAGIGPPVDFLETTTKTMDDLWEINIRGVMYSYQAAARQMIKQGEGGRLIAASSIAGLTGVPQLGMYSASKFAVRGLNQCAAAELGKYGIACNTYNPGVVQTDMWTGLDKFYSGKAGGADGTALAAVRWTMGEGEGLTTASGLQPHGAQHQRHGDCQCRFVSAQPTYLLRGCGVWPC